MHSFSTLPLAAAAIVTLCVWRIQQWAVKGRIGCTRIEADQELGSVHRTSRSSSRSGKLAEISAAELPALAGRDRNYILVDIAANGRSTFAGDRSTFVLSIAPGELPAVLEWLPADRAVVFRGVSDSARAVIEKSACMASAKPRCILNDFPVHAEVL